LKSKNNQKFNKEILKLKFDSKNKFKKEQLELIELTNERK